MNENEKKYSGKTQISFYVTPEIKQKVKIYFDDTGEYEQINIAEVVSALS